MAFQSSGFWVTVTLADNGDNRSTMQFQTDPAIVIDYATAVTQTGLLLTDLQAVTDSVVVGYSIAERYYNDSIALPSALVENENKASITLRLDGSNKKANIKIPAPISGMFVGASGASANQVDIANGLLVAYVDNFRTSGGFMLSDGEKADQILVGKRISARNNNG